MNYVKGRFYDNFILYIFGITSQTTIYISIIIYYYNRCFEIIFIIKYILNTSVVILNLIIKLLFIYKITFLKQLMFKFVLRIGTL